jgi:hypothetical protein
MAIVDDNDLTRGLRGRFAKSFVFRSLRGKTIASHAPRKPDPRKQSAAQRQTRTSFREAAAWAMHTLGDPKQKKFYRDRATELGLPCAYIAAVRDYMRNSIKTEERKSTPINLSVNKPVFVTIQQGKMVEGKHQHPDRQTRRPEDRTGIKIRETRQAPRPKINRTHASHMPRAIPRLVRGQTRSTTNVVSFSGRPFSLHPQDIVKSP